MVRVFSIFYGFPIAYRIIYKLSGTTPNRMYLFYFFSMFSTATVVAAAVFAVHRGELYFIESLVKSHLIHRTHTQSCSLAPPPPSSYGATDVHKHNVFYPLIYSFINKRCDWMDGGRWYICSVIDCIGIFSVRNIYREGESKRNRERDNVCLCRCCCLSAWPINSISIRWLLAIVEGGHIVQAFFMFLQKGEYRKRCLN